MATLIVVVHVGEAPQLGGGLRPAVVLHLYDGAVARFVVHEVDDDGTMERIPGE